MSDTIKKPVTHGAARVPVIMQLEKLECGAACLCMILAYYNKWVSLEEVRENCGVSRDGANARNIIETARFYGLSADGYRTEPDFLREKGHFPCIIHWNFNHFVVLNGFRGNKAALNDPANGTYTVSKEEFDESFTGICLMFEPSPQFVPSGKQKSIVAFIRKYLKGAGAAMAVTVLTGIIAAMIELMRPAFSRVFFDYLLTHNYTKLTARFLVFLGGFDLIIIIVTAIKSIYSLRINGKAAAVGNMTFMWKVLKLPMRFFSQRMASDIQNRQASNANIANTLVNTLAPLVLDIFMMLFYLIVMMRYSVMLSVIGLISIGLSAAVSQYIAKKRVNLTKATVRDAARLSSATTTGVDMIETIKASGAENGFFRKWSGYQAIVNTNRVRELKLSQYLGMLPVFISSVANNVVLFLGVYLAMKGEFTVGMIMAFQGFLLSFMSPANKIIHAGQDIQEMRTQMERLDDVMEYPDDIVFAEDCYEEGQQKLTGNITLKNVTFGYSPLADPLIHDFDIQITPGKSIAIVGASGCGKSTVSKLISGINRPWSGEILFDGKPMSEIPGNVFHSSVAVVDQDIILFEDTVSNNIKMWDESIDDADVIKAARDARIHEDIIQRLGGYHHRLIEGGKDFSGGQRQRMEIARALAQNPSVIIIDEGTSALDARTEYEVLEAVRKRNITLIMVAHRISTIRSCDEIIVMEHGSIAAKGTHDELMENCSLYSSLVSAE